DGLAEGVAQAGPSQLEGGVGKGTHPGKDHPGRRPHPIRIRRDLRGVSDRLERFLNAPEVPHPVVDDGDHIKEVAPVDVRSNSGTIVPPGLGPPTRKAYPSASNTVVRISAQ